MNQEKRSSWKYLLCFAKLCIEVKITGSEYLKVISDFIYFYFRGKPKKFSFLKVQLRKQGLLKDFSYNISTHFWKKWLL